MMDDNLSGGTVNGLWMMSGKVSELWILRVMLGSHRPKIVKSKSNSGDRDEGRRKIFNLFSIILL